MMTKLQYDICDALISLAESRTPDNKSSYTASVVLIVFGFHHRRIR